MPSENHDTCKICGTTDFTGTNVSNGLVQNLVCQNNSKFSPNYF